MKKTIEIIIKIPDHVGPCLCGCQMPKIFKREQKYYIEYFDNITFDEIEMLRKNEIDKITKEIEFSDTMKVLRIEYLKQLDEQKKLKNPMCQGANLL